MDNILVSVLWFALLGLVFGLILAIASKVLAIKRDERIEQVEECLPGANCGACGYPGCSGYAAAVVKGEAKIGGCLAGGNACAQAIAKIMGTEAENMVERRAQVLCCGTHDQAERKYIYDGAPDCLSASKLGGGDKLCPYGCLGLGSCANVCKFDAITVENGVATIDREKCTGCGECTQVCPKHIIQLVPVDKVYRVECMSEDSGKLTRSYCNVGCIGCRICEKNCESDAIHVVGSKATIDYDKCTNCGKCAEKCPRKIIRTIDSANSRVYVKE